jgi:adenosine deaminase
VAECDNYEDSHQILNFNPERLGHAAVVTKELKHELMEKKLPVEVCFTSNLMCKMCESHDKHPFHTYNSKKHPIIICTDDKGVFNTNLCKEYGILRSQLTGTDEEVKQQIYDIARTGIEYCFCSEQVKQQLTSDFDEFRKQYL